MYEQLHPILLGTPLNRVRDGVSYMSNTGYSCQECSWTVTADDVAEMSSQALDHHDETGHHVEYGARREQ